MNLIESPSVDQQFYGMMAQNQITPVDQAFFDAVGDPMQAYLSGLSALNLTFDTLGGPDQPALETEKMDALLSHNLTIATLGNEAVAASRVVQAPHYLAAISDLSIRRLSAWMRKRNRDDASESEDEEFDLLIAA